MTTPAHCTRTDPHRAHTAWDFPDPDRICPGVEPPADVQATPDPRLDYLDRQLQHVVARRITPTADGSFTDITLQRILDALDAMRPDEPGPDDHDSEVYHRGWIDGRNRGQAMSQVAPIITQDREQTAPAGLSAAQEIRLWLGVAALSDRQVNEDRVAAEIRALEAWAAWVEHGTDETPEEPHDYPAGFADGRRISQIEIAALVARVDLAEARLGHIADALRDYEGSHDTGAGFRVTVAECLAWTPDDTATAGAATGDE